MRFFLCALFVGCQCGGGHVRVPDGMTCEGDGECASGACYFGVCGGSPCGCGAACATMPKSSSDCDAGWACLGTADSLYLRGVCVLPCTLGCPVSWHCADSMVCSPGPPVLVQMDVAPAEVEIGVEAKFKGSATSSSGDIASFLWSFPDAGVMGAEASYTFWERGPTHCSLTATDVVGATGTVRHMLTVCLPVDAGCVPSVLRGYCCAGAICQTVEPDGGARCVSM